VTKRIGIPPLVASAALKRARSGRYLAPASENMP
jgi:hypothetical protein